LDYKKVDPSFGTEEDLKNLVKKAHELNMKVVLDGVFNHTSEKFFAFADIEKNGKNSKYLDWYFIEKFPLFEEGGKQANFKNFGYFGGMPKLNLRNPEVEAYIFEVATYWIKNCDIDGWRLDVGDEVGHRFWKRFRETVKAIKEDALIIGEVWHPANDYLEGDEWDTVMNYHFFLTVKDFVADSSISATKFMERMDFMRGTVHSSVYPLLWNLIDSHDTARFLHICGENKEKFKLAVAMQLLSVGMPMIYYGDEYGMTGMDSSDCRRGMVWKEEYQDLDMYEWYQKLIVLRKRIPALTEGEIISKKAVDASGLVIYEKAVETGEKVCVVFHNSEKEVELPEKKGQFEELSGQRFDGKLKGYQTLVLTEK
ncbi:MAG: glycoside hydrolase family 13 protein, partial [Clostridiales bacterium]|nr:glycoside hydrolase family 13 protein [Clostridiales bacterium]